MPAPVKPKVTSASFKKMTGSTAVEGWVIGKDFTENDSVEIKKKNQAGQVSKVWQGKVGRLIDTVGDYKVHRASANPKPGYEQAEALPPTAGETISVTITNTTAPQPQPSDPVTIDDPDLP